MQVSIYVSEPDYETLSNGKPAKYRTTSMYMTGIIRQKAESLRSMTKDGNPVIPQYERQ